MHRNSDVGENWMKVLYPLLIHTVCSLQYNLKRRTLFVVVDRVAYASMPDGGHQWKARLMEQVKS